MSEADEVKQLVDEALAQIRAMDSALLKYDSALQNLVGLTMQMGFDVPDLTPKFNAITKAKLEIIQAQLPIWEQLIRWRNLL
jgi:hypothetical protein